MAKKEASPELTENPGSPKHWIGFSLPSPGIPVRKSAAAAD